MEMEAKFAQMQGEIDDLQNRLDNAEARNRQLRHKAGQVFLDTLQKGAKLGKSVKGMSTTIYLQDDEAVARMM